MPSEYKVRRSVVARLRERGVDCQANAYVDVGEYEGFVDIIAQGPFATFAIEVENDSSSLRSGVSQAAEYAAAVGKRAVRNPPVYPAVVIPAETVEMPDAAFLEQQTGVRIVPWEL